MKLFCFLCKYYKFSRKLFSSGFEIWHKNNGKNFEIDHKFYINVFDVQLVEAKKNAFF
jgi:hypothetical protein